MTDAPDPAIPDTSLDELLSRIVPGDQDPVAVEAAAAAAARWDSRAKPPGSLGQVEAIGGRVAAIVGACPPDVPEIPAVVVFAGDHGVVADGASAWPSEVTGLMVQAMAGGAAAINAFATTVGASVSLVDVGVTGDLSEIDAVVDAKVRAGTASLASGPAMTRDEALVAIGVGAAAARVTIEDGGDLLVGGDMGIGNTTPSTALIAHFTASPVESIVGPGAGSTDEGIARKRDLIEGALQRLDPGSDPVDVLAAVGGLEIAALAGFFLGAAAARVPVIVDGVIACAAACVAEALAPGVSSRLIAGHRSTEPAASAALDHLGLDPVLDLDLRLGEGTGACLAVPIVQAACRALRDMADLPT